MSLGMTFNGFSYNKSIQSISQEYGLDCELIKSICKVESNFKTESVSHKGAVGIMQLMPSTAEWICKKYNMDYRYECLFEPEFNIRVGCLYLKDLLSKYPLEWAICAYNAGTGNVDNWLSLNLRTEDIPYKETREYLKKVMRYKRIYLFLI